MNNNESLVACDSDGKTYMLRGSLVAPASTLRSKHRAVTLYVHGAMVAGDNLWRMTPEGDETFDFGLAMARLGHASVSIDLVGYGSGVSSDGPDGNLVCQGSQATVIHQVVEKLRSGHYGFGDAPAGPSFDRVALAGLSYGAQFSQPAAYSFKDDIDAFIVMGYAEPPVSTAEFAVLIARAGPGCVPPGDRKYEHSGPSGYTLVSPDDAPGPMFFDPEPKAVAAWPGLAEADPCGQASSIPARAAADVQHLGEIAVPVLLAFGDHDELFGQPGPQVAFSRFTGSSDRTLMLFPGAGHVFFLEKQRAKWIDMIAGWLKGHGL